MKAKKIKLPSLAQMQLGPMVTDVRRKCGCLMFHASLLDGGSADVMQATAKADASGPVIGAIMRLPIYSLITTNVDNTLPNRRAALLILHKALRQCGYRIARDKKTAVLK